MAIPVPQADNGLSGRTAFQPAVAHSPAAGGEKTIGSEIEARKPLPLDKPATKPVVASGPVSAAAKAEKGPKEESPTATEWGLAPKKRPLITKLRASLALGAIAASVAGYFGYDRFYLKDSPGVADATGSPDAPDAADMVDANARSGTDSALDQSRDPFDDSLQSAIDEDPQATASAEPRKIRSAPKAVPIVESRRTHGRSPAKPSRGSFSLDDESLDLGDESDEAAPPRMTQSEPGLDEDDFSGPSLESSAGAHRRNGATRHATGSQNAAHRSREFSGGPRISSDPIRDNDLADDLPDDKLDGYHVAQHKHGKTASNSAGSPRISVIDVRDEGEPDERFEGYTAENPTTRRAVSKTRVIRPTDAIAQLPPSAGIGAESHRRAPIHATVPDDDFLDEAPEAPVAGRGSNATGFDDERELNRPSRDGVTPIRRRGSPPLPSAGNESRSHRPLADDDWQISDPASDIYRVMPEDNFWKISRKQYGTPRYFQALTRHNQDRVPDPQKLRPGTQISTPPVAVLEKRYPDLIEKSPPASATSGLAEHKSNRPRFERPVSVPVSQRDLDAAPERRTGGDSSAGYFYSKSGEPMYRIGSDDTLTGIAQRHLGRASRWTEIYDQNRDILKSPNDLTLGTVIRLPGDASRLSLVPESERRR